MKNRAVMVTFLALMCITACNKEEFVGTSVEIQGADAACAAGTDFQSCEAIPGCQPAQEDVESVEPVFASCIANPPEPDAVIMEPTPPEVSQPSQPSAPSSPSAPSAPSAPVVQEEAEPTIAEAYASKCENLKEEYLLIKNYSANGGSHKMKKVKVCHQTSSGEHAIIVACPALKAHKKHEDYLGACKE